MGSPSRSSARSSARFPRSSSVQTHLEPLDEEAAGTEVAGDARER